MMNRRINIYRGDMRPPPPPQFVSCRRLPDPPPPRPPRRTVFQVLEAIFYYISIVCIVILVLELVVQAVMYTYLQSPGGRSAATGQKLTHYGILGVDSGANQDAITEGWRQQSNAFHPDTTGGGNNEETRERYYWIQLAYVELSDPLARCYHDQYHGFLPRKWGSDDPCTKILMDRERESRVSTKEAPESLKNDMLRGLEKDYGVSANWLKVMNKIREWKNARWSWRQKQLAIWEVLEDYGKQFVAWQYVAVGFILAMIESYWGYFVEFGKKHFHEVRRRFNQLVEGLVAIWER